MLPGMDGWVKMLKLTLFPKRSTGTLLLGDLAL